MGVLLRFSQSSILSPQLHQFRRGSPNLTYARLSRNRSELISLSPSFCAQRQPRPQQEKSLLRWAAGTPRVVSDSKEDIEKIQPEDTTGGGDDGIGRGEGGEGGGGGGDNNDSNEGEGASEESDNNKKTGMSMSQKLTLAYAALIGVGGVMGYLKSGSTKSLVSGGLSALLLLFVYTELPTRPAFASSLGFGLSAALLVVMGSRFKKSGKIFPAGVVSFVSLVMSGGYIHGILRSLH